MQATISANTTRRNEHITRLHPAIVFECTMDGKKLQAKITHQQRSGLQFTYQVSFSDGYAAAFSTRRQLNEDFPDAVHENYARAVQDDLKAFSLFLPQRPAFHIRLKSQNEEAFNVWVVPYENKENYYRVFYKGDYRFSLRKAKLWEAGGVEKGININQEIAALVCKNIDERSMLPFPESAT